MTVLLLRIDFFYRASNFGPAGILWASNDIIEIRKIIMADLESENVFGALSVFA